MEQHIANPILRLQCSRIRVFPTVGMGARESPPPAENLLIPPHWKPPPSPHSRLPLTKFLIPPQRLIPPTK